MRIRITVTKNGDRREDLRVAADVRRDLWAHSPVEIYADTPLYGTHRDRQGRPYFEFSTSFPDKVTEVLRSHGHADHVELTAADECLGEACQNCGNIAGAELPAVCPNCGFRDISPCPSCGQEIPRKGYLFAGGRLFRCPNCRVQVRLRFNEPIALPDGSFNEPLVLVEAREVHQR